jgi:hypothetical protein
VKKEFVPTHPEDFIKKNGLRKPSKDAVLVKVVDVDYVYENDPSAGETVHPLEIGGNEYYIKNVGPEYVTYGSYVVASVEKSGATNGTLTLSQAVAVANSYNVSVSVNAQIITAAVGYNVTQTWTTTATYSQNVTKDNKITVIDAYDKYYQRSFEVWEDDVFFNDFVTTGTSKRHVGFRYHTDCADDLEFHGC